MTEIDDVDVAAILGPGDAVPGIDQGAAVDLGDLGLGEVADHDDIEDVLGGAGDDGNGADVDPADQADQDADDRLPLAHSDIPDEAGTDAWFKEMAEADPDVAATVRQAWGGDAALNLAFAKNAFDQFATKELADLFDNAIIEGSNGEPVSIGSHPLLMEILARIGRMIAREPGNPRSIKDTAHQKRTNTMTDEETIRGKLDVIHSWQHSNDLKEREKYKHPRTQKALDQLYRQLPGGDMPIVGREFRHV